MELIFFTNQYSVYTTI